MNSKAIKKKTIPVLLGYNLPFILWTCWAAFLALTGLHPAWPCPVRALFHFCPACGLTGQYADLLRGHRPSDFLLVILFLFLLNSGWSFYKAFRRPQILMP